MNRFIKRLAAVLLHLSVAVAVFGQDWAVPARTPNTEVPCTLCVGPNNALTNGKTVGYAAPIAAFTGRFLDSQATNDIQYPIRTLRAGKLVMSPDGRRLYMIMGGVAMAYDTASFISRLTASEALIPVTSIPINVLNVRAGAPEVFLRCDRYFNAEWGGGWTTPFVDGQARLNDIDVDDQGYLYVSHFVFGWGIVKDDLRTDGGMNLMPSQYQHYPFGDNGDQDPIHVLSFKSGTNYFMLVNVETQTEVWNVTDRTQPRRVQVMRINFSQAAKNAAGDRIAIADGSTGAINIYSADSLAAGGSPMATFSPGFPYSYASITTDGVNFFASYTKPSLKVEIFSPVGQTFGDQGAFDTGLSGVNAAAIRVSNGYLTMITSDGVLLYKVTSNLSFTEIPLKSSYGRTDPNNPNSDRYFPQYYFNAAPPGHGYPHFYVHASDAGVIKQGGKTYLLFLGGGLADVYEIQNGDGIALTSLGSMGTQNQNTPASERSKLFYGDPVGFTATTTAPVPMNITWNFGNPEAVSGADANTVVGQTGPGTVMHRFSGIASAAGLSTRTVQASNNADSSIFATAAVTMLAPVPRVSLGQGGLLFTQTVASSNAPVVVGDQWYDASDGSVEGHSSSWSLYNSAGPTTTPVVTSQSPALPLGTGPCGPHYLLFTGHYGQLATSFPASDFVVPSGGLGIGYSVRPYAANVTVSVNGSNLVFTNATKITANTDVMTAAILAGLQYKWELFNANGSLNQAGPTGAYSAIAPWQVPSSTISRGMTVRLTVTSPTDFAAGCGGLGYTISAYTTPPLNAPDPVIVGSCTNAPCTFTAGSISGVNPLTDGWTYAWTAQGTGAVANVTLTGASATFAPAFPQSGTYNISLIATNSFGSASAATRSFNVAVQVCAPYTPNVDVFITYGATGSGCTTGQSCLTGEVISFAVSAPFYNLGCGPHTFSWNFGDNGTSSGQSTAHSFGSANTYTVTCVVTDSSAGTQQTLTRTITLTGIQGCVTNCGGDPCTPGMNTASNFITFANNAGTCSATGGSCGIGEAITFTAGSFGYNYGCDTHTFAWNFGDGTTGSGITTTHSYSSANTYTASLTISRPNKGITFQTNPVTVHVGSSGCQPPMTAGTNVFIVYANADSSCTNTGGICAPGEAISFLAGSFNYDFNCAAHTFSWDYGDGNTGSGKSATHTYASPSPTGYTVKLTIANGGQSVTMSALVRVASKIIPPTAVDFTITPWFNNGVQIPNGYKFTPGSNPAGSVTKFGWDFGDGTCPAAGDALCTSAGEIYHVFPTNFNYRVTLSVKAPAGYPGVIAVHPLVDVPPRRRSAPHT